MNHAENEGCNENYLGLHQWDFTIENGCFTVKGRSKSVNVVRELADLGEFESAYAPDP